MNIINVSINFKERKCNVEGITMTEGDYNTSKMVFDFDIPTGVKMLEMKNPLGEIVYLDEIIDNEVVLVGKAQVIKVENDITYYKYLDNEENIYWYDKENDKLYNNLMVEIPEFNLDDYTPVLVNASLFNVAGEYVFEVSLYENDGKLTSAYGTLDVAPEQVDLDDPHGETKYPILEDLTNKVAEMQEDITELSVDVADLEENKQDTLVSGENIKTINNQSLLGDGDLNIDVPTKLSDLEEDSTHRTVTDTEKTTWNNKSDFSGDYNDLQNKPSIPSKTSDLNNDSGFITNQVNDLVNYELKTNTGSSIELSINSSTYVVTLSLKNSAGTILNTQTIDLPLESVVVNGSYDSVNKKIVLTLENGNTIDIPVGDLVAGLQSEITSSNKLNSDLVDDTNQTNKFVTDTEKSTWNSKVSPTDYANSSTGGVVKAGAYYFGARINNNGFIYAETLTYPQYLTAAEQNFIGKGTLENAITGKGLVSNTDHANASTGGVVKVNGYYGLDLYNGLLLGTIKTYSAYGSQPDSTVISKGTLENVLTARIGDINSVLDAINGEVI